MSKTLEGITSANIRLTDEEWNTIDGLSEILGSKTKNYLYKDCMISGALLISQNTLLEIKDTLSIDEKFKALRENIALMTKPNPIASTLTDEELVTLKVLLAKVKDLV